MLIYCLILSFTPMVIAYSNTLYTISEYSQNLNDATCEGFSPSELSHDLKDGPVNVVSPHNETTPLVEPDPMIALQTVVRKTLFGSKNPEIEAKVKLKLKPEDFTMDHNTTEDTLAQVPMGNVMRAELFQQKLGVHLPMKELVYRGHCHLKVSLDHMQTALNAFAILVHGTIQDVLRLPQLYVLRSVRAISMMKIEHEKLAATWIVVKGNRRTEEITYDVLEQYRPLFKYLTGKEMARLNLSDERILSYIGTHAELNRHQVGVVASTYIKLNPHWTDARYLNVMNNLLCGVPMTFMRKISDNNYLQLTHQVFYHIRACDPLQRRFYLAMMTRTQALGKAYSWSAKDISRLGLLLAEVAGADLSTINPKSMTGLTAQVMLEMSADRLVHITQMQKRYLTPKSSNILARKLNVYKNQLRQLHSAADTTVPLDMAIQFLFHIFFLANS